MDSPSQKLDCIVEDDKIISPRGKLPTLSTVVRLKERPLPSPEGVNSKNESRSKSIFPKENSNPRKKKDMRSKRGRPRTVPVELDDISPPTKVPPISPVMDKNNSVSARSNSPTWALTRQGSAGKSYGSLIEQEVKRSFTLDEDHEYPCRCGAKLVWTKAENCYPKSIVTGATCRPKGTLVARVVSCDVCSTKMRKTDFVYHCVKTSKLHPTGFDVCGPCTMKRPKRKKWVKQQLESNPDLQNYCSRGQLLKLAIRQRSLEVDVIGVETRRPPNSGRFASEKSYYTVKVDTGAYDWLISYRYSDFLKLHEVLQRLDGYGCAPSTRKLPKFPKDSNPFGSQSDLKKNRRMTAFRTYIKGLLSNKNVRDDPYLILFLCQETSIIMREPTKGSTAGESDEGRSTVLRPKRSVSDKDLL